MTQYRQFVKNVGLIGVTQMVLGIQSFFLLPILTKFLGASDYGIWSQIKITVVLLAAITMFGLESAVVRFMSGGTDRKKLSKEFSSILILPIVSALIAGAVIFALSNEISFLLTQAATASFFFKFVGLIVVLRIVHSLFVAFFRAKEDIKLYSITEITRAFLEVSLTYIFLFKGYGLLGVIGALIFVGVILVVFDVINVKKYIYITKPSLNALKPYFTFSLPLTITPVLFWVLQTGDQYVIGYFIGAKAVGIYALAYSLCRAVRILANPIYMMLYPALSKSWNLGHKKSAKIYFKYSYKYSFMIIIPAVFGLSFLMSSIVSIISTAEFLEGSTLIPIIAAGVAAYSFFIFATILLMLAKETKKITRALVFLAITNILLNILFVPLFGIFGAAVSTLITFLTAALYGATIIKRMGMDLMLRFILKTITSASIMSVFIYFIKETSIFGSIATAIIIVCVAVFIYFFVLYLLKGITREEVKFFFKILMSTPD